MTPAPAPELVNGAGAAAPLEPELLRAVLDSSPSFMHVLRGTQFIVEYANAAYFRLVGQRDLIGRPAFEAMPEAAEGGFPERIAGVMETGSRSWAANSR